jgi:hypothetical protein
MISLETIKEFWIAIYSSFSFCKGFYLLQKLKTELYDLLVAND